MPGLLAHLPLIALLTLGKSPSPEPSTPPARGLTTLATVQQTELFSALEFTLDSAESVGSEWRYHPASRALRPFITLQLTVLRDRSVQEVRLGMPPTMMRAMQLFLREPYADFVEAIVPTGDQDAIFPFLVQLREDLMGVADGEFISRDETVRGMPQRPTPMYAAFVNDRPRADAVLGASRIRIDNVGNGRDSATVLTVVAGAAEPSRLAVAEWVVESWDLLGAPAAMAGAHPLIAALELSEASREGRVVSYRPEDEDSPMTLTLTFGADDRVREISWRTPNPALLDMGEMALPTFLISLLAVLPHGDSTAVATVAQQAMIADDPSELSGELRALAQVLQGERDEAAITLPLTLVTVRREEEGLLMARVRAR